MARVCYGPTGHGHDFVEQPANVFPLLSQKEVHPEALATGAATRGEKTLGPDLTSPVEVPDFALASHPCGTVKPADQWSLPGSARRHGTSHNALLWPW